MSDKAYGPPLPEYQRDCMPGAVRDDIAWRVRWLPGNGMYPRHVVTLMAQFVIQCVAMMAVHAGPETTANALRRLADRVEAQEPLT